MQYRLRSLLILMAIGPPMLAGAWWIWPEVSEPPRQPLAKTAIASFDELIELIMLSVHPYSSWEDVGGPSCIDQFSSGCFVLLETFEDEPDGPDPCGHFRPSTAVEDGIFPSFNVPPIIERIDADPFAPQS